MASLCCSTVSHSLTPEVSAYHLHSSPRPSPFCPASPPLLRRSALRNPLPLRFNPLYISPSQASSPPCRPTNGISCTLDNIKARNRIHHTTNSVTPDAGHTPPSSLSASLPRPLSLASAAAISAALAFSALPALAADVTSFESLPQAESVLFRDSSALEKGMVLAPASLAAPSLESFGDSSLTLLPATVSPSIADNAVTVSLSDSVSGASKSGPIMQLASRDAASRGVVSTCSNLVAACVLLVWFQRVGTLPPSTAHVLAQVANRVLIPCFLAVHVASAVSSEPELVLSSLPLMAFAQVLCAASLGHLAHQSSPQSSSSSSFLPRPLHLSPLPSTALHQLAAAISVSLSSLNQPAAEPTTEPAAKSAAAAGGSDAAGNLGGRLGAPVMTLLLLVVMTAVCETGGGGDGLAGQLALLAVGGWAPALLILACNALLWIQTRPDAMDSSLLSSPSGPSLSNHFFTPPVLGVLAGLLIGATPLSQLFLLPRVTDGLADTSTLLIDSGSLLAWLQGQAGEMAGCMHCLMEAASFLGSAALPLHLMALVSSLVPPLEPSQAQHQQHQHQQQQQQQGILAPVKATRARDAAGTSPELPL